MYEGMFGGKLLRLSDEEYVQIVKRFTSWNAIVPPREDGDDFDFMVMIECPLCRRYRMCRGCPASEEGMPDHSENCLDLIHNEIGHFSSELTIHADAVCWDRRCSEKALRDIDHIRNTLLKFRKVTEEAQ